jgi:hypothetical protein
MFLDVGEEQRHLSLSIGDRIGESTIMKRSASGATRLVDE